MKKKTALIICALIVCAAAVAAAVALQPSGLMSVDELRAIYPYCSSSPTASMISREDSMRLSNGALFKDEDIMVVVEVAGDWSSSSETTYPNPAVDPQLTVDVTRLYLPVKVIQVCSSRKSANIDIQEGDTVYLEYLEMVFTARDAFHSGDRFVCFAAAGKEHNGAPALETYSEVTYYLTDSGQVMSLTNDKLMDSYSGKTLSQFKSAMSSVMKKSGW